MQRTYGTFATFVLRSVLALALLAAVATSVRADEEDASSGMPISLDTAQTLAEQLQAVTDFINQDLQHRHITGDQALVDLLRYDEATGALLQKSVTSFMLLQHFADVIQAVREDQEDARQHPVNPWTLRTVDASGRFLYDLIGDPSTWQVAAVVAQGLRASDVPQRLISNVFIVPHTIDKIQSRFATLDAALGFLDLYGLAIDGKANPFDLRARSPDDVSKAVGAVIKISTGIALMTPVTAETAALVIVSSHLVNVMTDMAIHHISDAYDGMLKSYLDQNNVAGVLRDGFKQMQAMRAAKGMPPETFEAYVGWDRTAMMAFGGEQAVARIDAEYGFKTRPPPQEPIEVTTRVVYQHYRQVCQAGICAYQDLGSASTTYRWYEGADPGSGQPRQVWLSPGTATDPQAAKAAAADMAVHLPRNPMILLVGDGSTDTPLSSALIGQFGAGAVRRGVQPTDVLGEHAVQVAVATPDQLVGNSCGVGAQHCPPPSAILRPCVGSSCDPLRPMPIVEPPGCIGPGCGSLPSAATLPPPGGVTVNPVPDRTGSVPDSIGNAILSGPRLGPKQ
jgi:hypothetical protein